MISINVPERLAAFLDRDLWYVIGGSLVVVAFLYLFDELPDAGAPGATAQYLFIVVVGFVVGSALAGLGQWLRLGTMAYYYRPRKFMILLYELHGDQKWKEDLLGCDKEQRASAAERMARVAVKAGAFRSRQSAGIIKWATLTPCTLVTAVFLAIRFVRRDEQVDLWMAIFALAVFAISWLLNRTTAMSVTQSDARVLDSSA